MRSNLDIFLGWILTVGYWILGSVTAKRLLLSPWFALSILVAGDVSMMGNVLPRGASFALAALAVAYVLRASLADTVLFTVAHIPFSPALPLPGFDSFALWRLVVLTLALRLLWKNRAQLMQRFTLPQIRSALRPYDWIGLALLFWATLSLIGAFDLVVGLRKLVFLANAAMLYIALRWLFARVPGTKRAALIGLATGTIGLLLFGIAQYAVISWVSLYDFWQGWSLDTIPVFYGEALGQTLNTSNTWFAYYPPPVPPTLRMFSLLPDSHSFGIMMLLGFLLALAAWPLAQNRKHRAIAIATATAFGIAIFVNGSRGIWLAAVPTALLAYATLIYGIRSRRRELARAGKVAFAGFLLLTLLFPLSSLISAQAHGAGIDDIELTLAFQRARSILDLDELSNRGRIGIWVTNLKSVAAHPVFGVGIGNAAVVFDESVSAARRGASAHNLYLDFAAETGVIGGLLSLAWFLAIFFTGVLLSVKNTLSKQDALLTLTVVLATAWLGVYNLVDVVFLNDRALLAYFVLLALFAVIPKRHETTGVIHA